MKINTNWRHIIKTVFLDFDGVLFDTRKEAYLLSRYAYSDIAHQIEINETEYQMFNAKRYLVTNSWQYFYIMKLIKNNTKNEIFSFEYQKAILNRDIETDSKFDNKFQEKRRELINNHYDFWNNLDKPFPFFFEIKKLQDKLNLVIVSTKNRKAIQKKLMEFELIIPEEKIIGKETLKEFNSKGDFLRSYLIKNNIPFGIFIDDNQQNLNSCKNIKELRTLLAGWGYCNPEHKGKTVDEIIKIIKEGL